jgi:hypothetical protein
MTYVNLQLNPERFTGYTGDSVRRIWDSIYKENCPKCKHAHSMFSNIVILGHLTAQNKLLICNSTDFFLSHT